ncbi:hypothetical protein [Lichenifustis flavocetrariae]|uniref:Uncharacterized protein n=1 Tax=Lichenifustis flavocetrariae TaxID=2949735 RepID=A0AA41Z5I8_9HYPH|nr:hypothetical protein [Lichenifustis flavocetrariae]MCW6510705.1 hypothetical protein [Lichenifustis flavocetrariae]
MRPSLKVISCVAGFAVLNVLAGPAIAAGAKPVNLKAGESVDIDNVYWVAKCKSLLRGKPVADILEGPSDVTVSIRDEKVTPRSGGCSQPIDGGVLVLKAPKEVKAKTEAKVTIRIKYPTSDGERQGSRIVNLTLFP